MPPREPISVNVDDWLDERLNGKLPWQTAEDARRQARDLLESMQDSIERKELDELLDKEARECSNCGKTERSYKEDYICYRCRDALDDES